MSDGNKTEQPTPKKLQDARKKGQVAQSQEIKALGAIAGCFAFIYAAWGMITDKLGELFEVTAKVMPYSLDMALKELGPKCIETFALIMFAMIGLVCILSIGLGFIQIGFLLSFKSVTPSLGKLSPKNWFQKVVSIKGVYQLAMSIIKTTALLSVVGALLWGTIPDLMKITGRGVDAIWLYVGSVTFKVAMFSLAVFAVFSVVDYLFQRQQFMKQMMMTKDEVKREFKEQEGDPEIKGKRKELAREIAMSDAGAQVRKSSVLVTNPEHIAVALRYEEGETDLPVIMAKGKGIIARHMIEVAKQEGIPIMQNVPLAHGLYDQGEVMNYIPSELIEPVAEVLAWASRIARQE